MSNPIYQQMNQQQDGFLQRFQQFQKSINGDPRQIIQDMLNKGQITQDQLNQAMQKANQLMRFMK